MKKIIPVLAVLGGAAAYVAYKMKKEEQKQIIDLDQGLLYDDVNAEEDMVEEAPISEPVSDLPTVDEALANAHEALDKKEIFATSAKKSDNEGTVDDSEHDEMFTHLTRSEMTLLKEDSDERMAALEQKGDVHDHERPVQHYVQFTNEENLTDFKNTVINRGYVITKGTEEHELVVLHITPMDMVKLMANIYYLADIAAQYNGVYKGWQSKVVY